jgi:hypothetical protein
MIGLHPDVVEYSSFLALQGKADNGPRGSGNESSRPWLRRRVVPDRSWKDSRSCREGRLEDKQYEVVLIGAGVRTPTGYFALVEKLINIVHK